MKLAKKMLACVLALAMVAVLGLTAFAAAPTMTLKAGDAVVGKTVTLTVAITGMAGTEAGNLEFTYDSTVLEYVDPAVVSQTDSAMGTAGSPAAGTLTYAVMYMTAATADQPELVTYTFKVLKAGDAEIKGTATSWDGTDAPADASLTISAHEAVAATTVPATAAPTTAAVVEEDASGTQKPVTKPSTSIQQTGEAGIAVIAGVMAIAAVAFVATKKKDEE